MSYGRNYLFGENAISKSGRSPIGYQGFECSGHQYQSRSMQFNYIVGWFDLLHDRELQESEPRCASSLFLFTANADDIDDYKVKWPPRPPHIQKVSGSIPPGSSPVLLCLLAVGCWLAVVAVAAAAAFGGASGHAAGNGGSSSGAGALSWCCCQCISATAAGGAAGVETDVVL